MMEVGEKPSDDAGSCSDRNIADPAQNGSKLTSGIANATATHAAAEAKPPERKARPASAGSTTSGTYFIPMAAPSSAPAIIGYASTNANAHITAASIAKSLCPPTADSH